MTQRFQPNFISFFLMVAALAGNAQIGGFDIFLCLAVPVAVILVLQDTGGTVRAFSLLGFMAFLPFAFLLNQALAVDIPYFELYWLWPIKAALLAFMLLRQRGVSWPLENDLMLAGLTTLLLATSSIEEGRLISFFGPNMLYRFFGASFILMLVRAHFLTGGRLTLAMSIAAISVVGMLLTGSVGALGVLIAAFYFARSSLLRLIKTFFGFFVGVAALAALYYVRDFLSTNIMGRIESKLDNIDRDERLNTWLGIWHQDPGLFGEPYSRYMFLWTDRIPYPHNFIMELYAFYGWFGFAIALFTLFSFISARKTRYYMYFPLVVILIGSLFSGDLSDNFAIFAMPAIFAARYSQFVQSKQARPVAPSLKQRVA